MTHLVRSLVAALVTVVAILATPGLAQAHPAPAEPGSAAVPGGVDVVQAASGVPSMEAWKVGAVITLTLVAALALAWVGRRLVTHRGPIGTGGAAA